MRDMYRFSASSGEEYVKPSDPQTLGPERGGHGQLPLQANSSSSLQHRIHVHVTKKNSIRPQNQTQTIFNKYHI